MKISKVGRLLAAAVVSTSVLSGSARAQEAVELAPNEPMVEERADFARFYVSPGIGYMIFEGDEPLEDGFYLTIRLGYDIDEWWSVEGSFIYAPSLDENFVGTDDLDKYPGGKKSFTLEPNDGFGDTYMLQTYVDFLFHFTRWERLDPYLTAGGGFTLYGEDIIKNGDNWSANIRAGGGIMYHLSEEWALRADARLSVAGYNTEFNAALDLGFAWTWGAGAIKSDPVFAGDLDSDGDGLPDWYELEIGTDPYNADTDGDGLSDGDEVRIYGTDPLNPDTDFDMLSDGAEVLIHGTDPLNPDTDGGGVRDGHEVLVDKTNPLDPSDDVMLFELDIRFDTDKAVIKQQYFADLEKIVKVLTRNPQGTATVEGHADRRKTSNYKHNMRLSQQRAEAVRLYLIDRGIAASRIKAQGYGYDRPKAQNDPVNGNLANRRVDVYLYNVGGHKAKEQYLNP